MYSGSLMRIEDDRPTRRTGGQKNLASQGPVRPLRAPGVHKREGGWRERERAREREREGMQGGCFGSQVSPKVETAESKGGFHPPHRDHSTSLASNSSHPGPCQAPALLGSQYAILGRWTRQRRRHLYRSGRHGTVNRRRERHGQNVQDGMLDKQCAQFMECRLDSPLS